MFDTMDEVDDLAMENICCIINNNNGGKEEKLFSLTVSNNHYIPIPNPYHRLANHSYHREQLQRRLYKWTYL